MNPQDTSLERSSEFLRLALAFMSRYRVPVTPQNYAVWYAYVAGTNVPLKETIEVLIAADERVDQEVTAQLFQRFVDTADTSSLEEAHRALRSLVESVASTLLSANGEVSRYGESLKDTVSRLNDDISPADLKFLVRGIEESTSRMCASSEDLQRHLEESRHEAEALREELAKARAEARTDAMTGLINRTGLEEAVNRYRDSQEYASGDTCLLICDIDSFKGINDAYGHLFGDQVIKALADVLVEQTKGKDLVARYGGDEFVLLLPDTSVGGAVTVAEFIRLATQNIVLPRPKTGEKIRPVTISVGISRLAWDEVLSETISRADKALYAAKANGRNRVEVNSAFGSDKAVNG